jgi:hypothetical protein
MGIRVSTPAADVVAFTDVAPIPGLGFFAGQRLSSAS